MELKDTAKGMSSPDYKKRFVAEYQQLKIRYEKLDTLTAKYQADKLDFEPTCPLALLLEQQEYMRGYLRCLKVRAEFEGIDLESEE